MIGTRDDAPMSWPRAAALGSWMAFVFFALLHWGGNSRGPAGSVAVEVAFSLAIAAVGTVLTRWDYNNKLRRRHRGRT
jgi:hypothetical protein